MVNELFAYTIKELKEQEGFLCRELDEIDKQYKKALTKVEVIEELYRIAKRESLQIQGLRNLKLMDLTKVREQLSDKAGIPSW